MKPLLVLAVLLVSGYGQAPARNETAAPRPYRPPIALPTANLDAEQTAIVDRIEREVHLPRGADSLASYARYYAWQRGDYGHRKVIGSYLSGSIDEGQWRPGRYWAEERRLPLIVDGGCAHVTLTYDVAAHHIEQVACGGPP